MVLERKDVDAKYKWDLTAIYKDEAAFLADFKAAEAKIKEFSKHEKAMNESAEGLYLTLRDMADIEQIIEKLWQYAFLNFSVDTSDNAAQANTQRVRSLAISAGNASWFVTPNLLRLKSETIESWQKEYQPLSSFARLLEKNSRLKPHTLSDECEKLISRMEECFGSHSDIRGIFADSDLRFGKIKDEAGKTVELTDSNYVLYLRSLDRRVRRSAFTTVYKTYEQFGNTFATMYNGYVKEKTTQAAVRNYKNSITASTFQDEVTPVIYNNLIKSVRKGLPALYDYYALKKEVLGVDRIHLYDVYAPLVGSLNQKYDYETAVEEVLETVKIYGDEYYENLRAGLTEKGWVDVYPTRSKRGGAFSSGVPGTEPYILLNYNGTLDDVSTLAHEAGHSMHSWFSINYNEPHNSGYTIFVAEVASTVNELLLSHRKLRESTSKEEKLHILNELMETYKGTLYRQTMFAEFERDMHALSEKGVPLTADVLNKNYYKLVRKYFGSAVVCDKQIAYEWMRIPHFYRNFYVYKYATCISAASAIVKRIENEGESYVGKYIDFLKCGDSKSPLDSLKVAGIDMSDPEVVNGAVEDFASAVKEFRRVYNEE